MANKNTILGNFHKPSSESHPSSSFGNQQIFDNRKQVGSIEYSYNTNTNNVDLTLNNTKGNKIGKL